ncbi:hypothetical protein PybrP1_002327, partial [[Pythium] brassicae (nom. inval.)]
MSVQECNEAQRHLIKVHTKTDRMPTPQNRLLIVKSNESRTTHVSASWPTPKLGGGEAKRGGGRSGQRARRRRTRRRPAMRTRRNKITRAMTASAEGGDSEWSDDVPSSVSISDEDESEIRIDSSDNELRDRVTQLIQADGCEARCLEGKADKPEAFICSISQMAPREKKTSIMTWLAVPTEAEVMERRRRYGICNKSPYILPLVGKVCKAAWSACQDDCTYANPSTE